MSTLNSFVDETTVNVATDFAILNRTVNKASSSNVMQRISTVLSTGSYAQKGNH